MNRVGSLLLRGVLSVLGLSLVSTASAQVDPLAPLPTPVTQSPPPPYQGQAPVVRPVPTTALNSFQAYKSRLTYIARAGGIREATIAAVVPYLQLNGRAMRLDRSGQPGNVGNTSYTPPFEPYRRRHVSADLIRRGQSRYASLWPWL